jgi:flagellar hook-basal body complex protein FliE
MVLPVSAATSAYANAAKLLNQGGKPAINQVADARAMDMVNGKGDMVDVVTAISETELAMNTMVAVRDRVISAYEEIMRMPI